MSSDQELLPINTFRVHDVVCPLRVPRCAWKVMERTHITVSKRILLAGLTNLHVPTKNTVSAGID